MVNPAMVEELAKSYAWIEDTEKLEADTGVERIPDYIRGENEELVFYLITVGAIAKYGLPEGLK
jgi:hypothetical protein